MLMEEVAKIMSTIKKMFPLATFDVMTHLVVHLVEELDLCGPIHTRWMYLYRVVHESSKRVYLKRGK
jgi:hypothetical protein